jgi:WS/DGAT/MGAT family acyltransferase
VEPRRASDGHGERLSALDHSFLSLEGPTAHMHIGWFATFAPAPGGERPTVESVRERIAARVNWVPRCRQRLAFNPLDRLVGEPRWVDDVAFDLATHVTELAGAPERFPERRDALLATALDRARPLWHVALAPRLADGRIGVVGRVHHAMADGIAATQVAMLLLDDQSGEEGGRSDTWCARPAPPALRWTLDPLLDGAELTGRALRELGRAACAPRAWAREAAGSARRLAQSLREDVLAPAPAWSLNVPIGPERTVIGHRAPMAELREAQAAHGGTVNDVALAAVAGALRAQALERGERPCALKAMVPVSVRRTEEYGQFGNRIAPVAIWLPLQHGSPVARLQRVRVQTERFKRDQRQQGSRALLSGLALTPGPARRAVARAAASPRAHNLVISNVAGPPAALYMFGARLQEIYPVVPLGPRNALSIGMLSYDGHLHFGVQADPGAFPGAARLPELLAREIEQLADRRSEPATVTSLSAHRAAGARQRGARPVRPRTRR